MMFAVKSARKGSFVDRFDGSPRALFHGHFLAAHRICPDEAAWKCIGVIPRRTGGVALEKVVARHLRIGAAKLGIDGYVSIRAGGQRHPVAVVAEYIVALELGGAKAVDSNSIIGDDVVVNKIATGIIGAQSMTCIVRDRVVRYFGVPARVSQNDAAAISIDQIVADLHIVAHEGGKDSASIIAKDVILYNDIMDHIYAEREFGGSLEGESSYNAITARAEYP